jgi:hypothetical protein
MSALGRFLLRASVLIAAGWIWLNYLTRWCIPFGGPCFRANGHHCADWNSVPSASCLKRCVYFRNSSFATFTPIRHASVFPHERAQNRFCRGKHSEIKV